MVSLDYIKDNAIWVVKFTAGRITCKGSELSRFYNNDDVRDMDFVVADGQPDELKDFFRSYEHAVYDMNRHDLYMLDDFYAEWEKDPEKFRPKYEKTAVIGKLHSTLSDMDDDDDVLIVTYDNKVVGNHTVRAYKSALNNLGRDYDITKIEDVYGTKTITIQDDDIASLREESNEAAWYYSMHPVMHPVNDGAVWVNPHFRNGKAVKGHYRKRRK